MGRACRSLHSVSSNTSLPAFVVIHWAKRGESHSSIHNRTVRRDNLQLARHSSLLTPRVAIIWPPLRGLCL